MLAAIAARDWPGHVRELRNAAERFALGLEIADAEDAAGPDTLSDRMAAHEKALIAAALAAHSGSLKATYEALGLSRKASLREDAETRAGPDGLPRRRLRGAENARFPCGKSADFPSEKLQFFCTGAPNVSEMETSPGRFGQGPTHRAGKRPSVSANRPFARCMAGPFSPIPPPDGQGGSPKREPCPGKRRIGVREETRVTRPAHRHRPVSPS
jgi:hypothetical protein